MSYMEEDSLVLGVDQGASKTLAVLADGAGRIYGVGRAGGADQSRDGVEKAADEIEKAAEDALAQFGISRAKLAYIGIGACGADFPADNLRVQEAVQARMGVPAAVTNDVMAALMAEYAGEGAVMICAGSGMNIAVRGPEGVEDCLGYYLDDALQGGQAIGMAAIRKALDAEIGLAPETALKQALLDHFEMPDIDRFMEWFFAGEGLHERARVREFTPYVDAAAMAGDEVAIQVLKEFAVGTARYAAASIRNAGFSGHPVKVFFSGGIFKMKAPVIREGIMAGIRAQYPDAEFFEAAYEPVLGGTMMAEQLLYNGEVPEKVVNRLKESADDWGLERGVEAKK